MHKLFIFSSDINKQLSSSYLRGFRQFSWIPGSTLKKPKEPHIIILINGIYLQHCLILLPISSKKYRIASVVVYTLQQYYNYFLYNLLVPLMTARKSLLIATDKNVCYGWFCNGKRQILCRSNCPNNQGFCALSQMFLQKFVYYA